MKLQTPEYIKDQFLSELIGVDKSFLSRCKSGDKKLSPEKLGKLWHVIDALASDIIKYREYLYQILPGEEIDFKEDFFEKLNSSLSGDYKEIHKKLTK